jgi:hypothetical protein
MTESEQAQAYLDGQERRRAARKAYNQAMTEGKAAQAQIDKGKAMYIAGTQLLVDAYALEDQLANDTRLTHYDAQAVEARMRALRRDGRAMRNAAAKETRAGKVALRAANVARDKAAAEARDAGLVMKASSGAPRGAKPSAGLCGLLEWEEA